MAYEFELDEWRSAVGKLSEFDRMASCRHGYGRRGVCQHCSDDEPRGELEEW